MGSNAALYCTIVAMVAASALYVLWVKALSAREKKRRWGVIMLQLLVLVGGALADYSHPAAHLLIFFSSTAIVFLLFFLPIRNRSEN